MIHCGKHPAHITRQGVASTLSTGAGLGVAVTDSTSQQRVNTSSANKEGDEDGGVGAILIAVAVVAAVVACCLVAACYYRLHKQDGAEAETEAKQDAALVVNNPVYTDPLTPVRCIFVLPCPVCNAVAQLTCFQK